MGGGLCLGRLPLEVQQKARQNLAGQAASRKKLEFARSNRGDAAPSWPLYLACPLVTSQWDVFDSTRLVCSLGCRVARLCVDICVCAQLIARAGGGLLAAVLLRTES